MCTAARFFGETGDRRPEQPGGANRLGVDVVDGDLQVRRTRLAVEVERKVVGGKDFAERHRGGEHGVGGHETVVHAQARQLGAHVAAERVVAHTGDQPGALPESGSGDGDVGGTAAEELSERLHILEPDADL